MKGNNYDIQHSNAGNIGPCNILGVHRNRHDFNLSFLKKVLDFYLKISYNCIITMEGKSNVFRNLHR